MRCGTGVHVSIDTPLTMHVKGALTSSAVQRLTQQLPPLGGDRLSEQHRAEGTGECPSGRTGCGRRWVGPASGDVGGEE